MSLSVFEEHTPSDSDDEEIESQPETEKPEHLLDGTLSKWTNYIHGWQNRYVILRDGNLSYYKSEFDTAFGCRGSVSLAKATIEVHEFDDCRFDVRVNDCIYYLRAKDPEERHKWVSALEAAKQAESGYGSETHLPKVGSVLSLTSLPSVQSSSSFKIVDLYKMLQLNLSQNLNTVLDCGNKELCTQRIPECAGTKKGDGLREKLLEMETFRDILCRQIDTLQGYFDLCADRNTEFDHQRLDLNDDDFDEDPDLDELSATPTPHHGMMFSNPHESSMRSGDTSLSTSAIDFRGEAITFKATTAGILAVLSHCIETMTKREEQWKKRLEKERERRRKLQEHYKEVIEQSKKVSFVGGPDFEEGPYSKLNEEEFFDAVETALDREDEESELTASTKEKIPPPPPAEELIIQPTHRLSAEVEQKVHENLLLVKEEVCGENTAWYLVHEDGDMMVYRKDYEIDGIVCDPLKASHIVPGVTGHEMCHYFFDKDVRMEWESTVDKVKVLEKLADNCIIFHQVHKRIWPSSQRDTCFVCHLRQLSRKEEGEKIENQIGNAWIVTNFSCEHDDAPSDRYVRALANVIMFCQTFARPGANVNELTRDDLFCKLTYTAQVNPGGWAPPSAVRAVSKREYPKFLRKFSKFVQDVTLDKPIML